MDAFTQEYNSFTNNMLLVMLCEYSPKFMDLHIPTVGLVRYGITAGLGGQS